MSTVVVTFRAQPGQGPVLLAWLRAFHARLRDYGGFEHIAIYFAGGDPDVVVEIERWSKGEDHRRMVERVAELGGWDELSALLADEPRTLYLEAAGGATRSAGISAMTLPFSGGCACGAIRYECAAQPLMAVNCFCRDCQHASGGACSTGIGVPAGAVRIEGEPRRYVTKSATDSEAWRSFCPACGSPLFAGTSGHPDVLAIKVASLDDPSACAPTMQIWTQSAPAWAWVAPELPSFETQP